MCDICHNTVAVMHIATACGTAVAYSSRVVTGPHRPALAHTAGSRMRYSVTVYAAATPTGPHGNPATNDKTLAIDVYSSPTLAHEQPPYGRCHDLMEAAYAEPPKDGSRVHPMWPKEIEEYVLSEHGHEYEPGLRGHIISEMHSV